MNRIFPENSMAAMPMVEDGRLQTTKTEEPSEHGMGIRNVIETVAPRIPANTTTPANRKRTAVWNSIFPLLAWAWASCLPICIKGKRFIECKNL